MDIATRVAEMSFAERLKVGCVVVKDNNIVSFSWNGTLPTRPNECEMINAYGDSVTTSEVLHAEENAILKAAKTGISLNQSEIYVTHFPCIKCARMIIACGIKKIYYKEEYGNMEAVDLFKNMNVKVEKI